MIAIPIYPSTLELVGELNGGVIPEFVWGEVNYFIYKGMDEVPEIISIQDAVERGWFAKTDEQVTMTIKK